MLLVAKEPCGHGIDGLNFHHLVEKYYGPSATTSQSHSGIINFLLANGVVGTLLLVIFLGSLVRLGWLGFYRRDSLPGFFLTMLVLGFFFRGMWDDIWRDSMLEEFAFLTMFLFCWCRGIHV
ncbi:hypothetical protein GKE73_09775 [Paludibacterium sp. dN 18-1]|uniref:Uncharacterized protein n=1 Tax=Paludibacterium denitrificans TaxID=2675226 RepID=A0A844GEI3_9NEIS|nr:hypothetical protein [Paludibacterium denitrificans]